MNRTGQGHAGAGDVLGRTRKLRLALVVRSPVAGRRLNLTPRALADLVAGQLRDSPQFKESGDQSRADPRGVGRAVSGAVVERQSDAFTDRLHGPTAGVRDRLAGVVPGGRGEDDEAYEEKGPYDEDDDAGAYEADFEDEPGYVEGGSRR